MDKREDCAVFPSKNPPFYHHFGCALIRIISILIQSVCETVVPKLIAEDIPLLHSLLQDVFPGVAYRRAEMAALRKEIAAVCKDCHLVFEEGEQASSLWVDKVLQLYQIQLLAHGVVMVSPSG
uniref:Dynein heavy chain hydrolytic ATP-binding dynein motor region domain-containing protein n=1 Tax=Amphimedon queenslandica TaxID=400682 RepID=A0A1X7TJZ7_AMPQE